MHQSLSHQKTFQFHQLSPPSTTADFISLPSPFFPPHHRPSGDEILSPSAAKNRIETMVSQNPVIVIGCQGCCMVHVVKRLLLSLGVNPAMYELNNDDEEQAAAAVAGLSQFPAVFIGGELFGGLDKVMATHISGELTPILKQAGALWL